MIYFFLLNLIIIVIKKIVQPMGLARPNPTQPNPCGLGWTHVLGLVEFSLTHYGGLGQKLSSVRPNPTHAHSYQEWMVHYGKNDFFCKYY